MPKAFITGINGQDGSYLTEHLLNMGYEVGGLKSRLALPAAVVQETMTPVEQ